VASHVDRILAPPSCISHVTLAVDRTASLPATSATEHPARRAIAAPSAYGRARPPRPAGRAAYTRRHAAHTPPG